MVNIHIRILDKITYDDLAAFVNSLKKIKCFDIFVDDTIHLCSSYPISGPTSLYELHSGHTKTNPNPPPV